MPNVFDQFDPPTATITPDGKNPFDAFDANPFDQFDEPGPEKYMSPPGGLKLNPLQQVQMQSLSTEVGKGIDPENAGATLSNLLRGNDDVFLQAVAPSIVAAGKKVYSFLSTPLTDYLPHETPQQQAVSDLHRMALAHDVSPVDDDDGLGEPGPTETGIIKGVGNLANGFTSPIGLGMPWLGGLPAWAQRAISIGFAAQMAKDTPDIAAQLGTEIGKNPEDRDNEKIANLIMQGVGTVAMTSGAGLHGVFGETPTFAKVPEVAPATTMGARHDVAATPNSNEIPGGQSVGGPNSEIAVATATATPTVSDPYYVYSTDGMGGLETTQAGVKNYVRRQNNVLSVQIVNDPNWTHNGYGVRGTVQDGKIIVNRAFIDSADTLQEVLGEEHNHVLLSSKEGRQVIRDAGGSGLGTAQIASLAPKYPIRPGESVPNYQARLMNEFISKAASLQLPVWKQIVERVKTWLASKGIGGLSDEETARAVMRALKAGKPIPALTPNGTTQFEAPDSVADESTEENSNLAARYNLTDEPLEGISAKKATEATNQFFGTKRLPAQISVIRAQKATGDATIQGRNIVLNAARISTPEQAPQAILNKGVGEIWSQPEAQNAWQYVHSNLTAKELMAAFNRRKAQGLPTDSVAVREEAATARMMNSDGRDRVVGNFHNAIRAAFKQRFGFDVPVTALPQLKQAAIQVLRERNNAQDAQKAVALTANSDAVANSNNIPTIRGRRPINSKYAGQTHPSGIRFSSQAFADFSPHAIMQVKVDGLTGNYDKDEALANKAVGFKKTPPDCVWHHVQDGETIQLIPKPIHKDTRHTGGAAVIRNKGFDR